MLQRLVVFFATFAFVAALHAEEGWFGFRGPNQGVSEQTGLPTTWQTTGQNVLWKTDIDGMGASCPIVVDGRIYLTSYAGYGVDADEPGEQANLTRSIDCFDLATGKKLGSVKFEADTPETTYQGFQALHGYASSTLVSDGKSLYYFFGRSGVGAVDSKGNKLWHTSVGDGTHGWGSGTSPILYKNLVIVNASVESGKLVALDCQDGKIVWEADGMEMSWSTPQLVTTAKGDVELVVSVKNLVVGFNPETGEQLWSCAGIRDYICPTVVSRDGVVYAIGARRSTAMAIKAGGRGNVTDSNVVWEIKAGSNVSSPVYHDGNLYWFHESRSTAYCVDAKTGEEKFEVRINPSPGRIYASPVVADGKIYIVTRENGVLVLQAAPEYKLLAHNEPLDDSIFNASPTIVDGKILLRSDKRLYCLAQPE
jgi:outer membrane protein assembly factor BamB